MYENAVVHPEYCCISAFKLGTTGYKAVMRRYETHIKHLLREPYIGPPE